MASSRSCRPGRLGIGDFRAFLILKHHEGVVTAFTQGGAVARFILFDEYHLSITVSRGLAESACTAIRRRLCSRSFQTQLEQVIRDLFQRHLPLRQVRLRVSR